jgi:AcrR family transcriptional regulator
MPPSETPPGEHLRERALAAMIAATGTDGYLDTTVKDVIGRAVMSRRTFYRLFTNLEDCFLAAYDLVSTEALEVLGAAPTAGGTWQDHVEQALARVLRYLARNPDRARLLVVEPVTAGSRGLERHEHTMHALTQRLARTHTRPQPELRFEAGVGAVYHVVHARVLGGHAEQLPRLVPQLTRLLVQLADADLPLVNRRGDVYVSE